MGLEIKLGFFMDELENMKTCGSRFHESPAILQHKSCSNVEFLFEIVEIS